MNSFHSQQRRPTNESGVFAGQNNPNVQASIQQLNNPNINASMQRASYGAQGQLPYYSVAMLNSPSGQIKDHYQSQDKFINNGGMRDPAQINQSIQHLPKINGYSPG